MSPFRPTSNGPHSDKLNRTFRSDHGYPISTAIWPRKRWLAPFCFPTGLWQLDIVFDWVPGRLATDFSVHRAHRWTRYFTRTCVPYPVAQAEERGLQPLIFSRTNTSLTVERRAFADSSSSCLLHTRSHSVTRMRRFQITLVFG